MEGDPMRIILAVFSLLAPSVYAIAGAPDTPRLVITSPETLTMKEEPRSIGGPGDCIDARRQQRKDRKNDPHGISFHSARLSPEVRTGSSSRCLAGGSPRPSDGLGSGRA